MGGLALPPVASSAVCTETLGERMGSVRIGLEFRAGFPNRPLCHTRMRGIAVL